MKLNQESGWMPSFEVKRENEGFTREGIEEALKNGEEKKVKVRRSSGDIEEGWRLTGIDEAGGILVTKIIDGKLKKKTLTLEELRAVNQ